jgi:NAD(P)-dependent dehydrogenase (short-subunit alcohol dehydrogenase family)
VNHKTEQMENVHANKRVVIAGGSSGIGLATARQLAERKFDVTITGRDPAKLKAAGEPALFSTATVNSSDRKALDDFFKKSGSFNHLVLTLSGSKGAGLFKDLSLDYLKEGFEGKFWPQLNTIQAALPYLNEGGSITIVTAISSTAKIPGSSGLAAINGALELMVPVLAKELKPVRINAVSPGVIDTPWWNFLPADTKKQTFDEYASKIPAGRVGKPEEVADVIYFLISNAYVTGQVIGCDGGLSLS